jgi:hypothetical protein
VGFTIIEIASSPTAHRNDGRKPDRAGRETGAFSLPWANKLGDLRSKALTGPFPTGRFADRRLRTLETSEIIMISEITHDYWINLHGLTFDQRSI